MSQNRSPALQPCDTVKICLKKKKKNDVNLKAVMVTIAMAERNTSHVIGVTLNASHELTPIAPKPHERMICSYLTEEKTLSHLLWETCPRCEG